MLEKNLKRKVIYVTQISGWSSAIFLCSPTFTRIRLRITVEGKGPSCCVTLLAGSQSSFSLYLSTARKSSCMKTHCHMNICYMNNRTDPAPVIKGKVLLKKKINFVLYFFPIATFPRSCNVDQCTFLYSSLYLYQNSCSAAHTLHKYKVTSCLYLLCFWLQHVTEMLPRKYLSDPSLGQNFLIFAIM